MPFGCSNKSDKNEDGEQENPPPEAEVSLEDEVSKSILDACRELCRGVVTVVPPESCGRVPRSEKMRGLHEMRLQSLQTLRRMRRGRRCTADDTAHR